MQKTKKVKQTQKLNKPEYMNSAKKPKHVEDQSFLAKKKKIINFATNKSRRRKEKYQIEQMFHPS